MEEIDQRLPHSLIDLLSNSLILRQTAPYIPIRDLRRLAATSKAIRQLLYTSPEAWNYLNLTGVKRAIIATAPIDIGGVLQRAERMDESLTEDEFYCGPLRGILGRFHSNRLLKFVQTLILDGLTVPADLVREIVSEDRYRVRVLSLREARQLNITKLQQVMRYICRPTREAGTPTLKALYYFGPKDAPRVLSTRVPQLPASSSPSLGVMGAQGAQIGAEWNQRSTKDLHAGLGDEESKWYGANGRAIKRPYSEWAETLAVCSGLVQFDAVLCRGPRHDISKVDSKDFLQPTIATVALGPAGCESCHSCPEGPAVFGSSPDCSMPLLGPAPLHSSTVRAALRPERQVDGRFPSLILRCEDCLRQRWCEQCNRWWCEDCYAEPVSRAALRTEMQQVELREQLQENGWATVTNSPPASSQVKVFSKLCVEHCLVGEMMAGAGSNGMWG